MDDGSTLTPRQQLGSEWFAYTMHSRAPTPETVYRDAGILNFVFAEMWSRPGLDMRSRRWITLACVAAGATEAPIRTHVYAALKSGDISYSEAQEFVLQLAVYHGWPRASYMDQVIREEWARIEKEGGPTPLPVPRRPE